MSRHACCSRGRATTNRAEHADPSRPASHPDFPSRFIPCANTRFSTLFAAVTLGLAMNACSLLGTYANGASSMMSQPGAATPGTATGSGESSTSGTPNTPSTTAEQNTAPDKPSTVSVTLVNSCKENVKLFFGDKPKFGSGRYDSMSSNSRTNHTFKPDDQLWIVDEGQNGVASVKIEAGMREVEVVSGCKSFRSR